MIDNNLEIPDALRNLAQQSVLQARDAYDQFVAAARQAQGLAANSSGSVAAAVKELQQRSMQFAEQNAEAGLSLAGDLAKARDLNEWVEIQQQHARQQAEAYTQQTQELVRLISSMSKPTV